MSSRILLSLGRDVETGDETRLEADRSRAVFICGKRGSGKSYTMGVLIEELFDHGKDEVLILIVDPMGIYHTMILQNKAQPDLLAQWGVVARSYPIRLFVPGDPTKRLGSEDVVQIMTSRGVEVLPLRVNAAELSPESWCSLLGLGINDLMGIVLYRVVATLKESRDHFTLDDMERAVQRDKNANDKTKEALQNRLIGARQWDIFQTEREPSFLERANSDALNVVDLADLEPGPDGLRNLITSVLGNQVFGRRTKARRREEFGLSGGMPRTWLFIDEAHQFAPSGQSSLSKDLLVRWVKEGRQPGLSLVVATQQPSAIDSELLSQCDVVLCHKITNYEDILALNRLSATYMGTEMKTLIRALGRQGQAVLVDDERESVALIEVRPRRSAHGGGEEGEGKIRRSLF